MHRVYGEARDRARPSGRWSSRSLYFNRFVCCAAGSTWRNQPVPRSRGQQRSQHADGDVVTIPAESRLRSERQHHRPNRGERAVPPPDRSRIRFHVRFHETGSKPLPAENVHHREDHDPNRVHKVPIQRKYVEAFRMRRN